MLWKAYKVCTTSVTVRRMIEIIFYLRRYTVSSMRMTLGLRGWWASLVTVPALVILAGIFVTLFSPSMSSPLAQRDRLRLMSTLTEPPRRPSSFASVDELNNYLEELRQYYTLLGRPR